MKCFNTFNIIKQRDEKLKKLCANDMTKFHILKEKLIKENQYHELDRVMFGTGKSFIK